MKFKEWSKVILYLLIWIFSWTLLEKLAYKYKLRDNTIIKICIVGLLFIFIYIQMNKEIKI